MRQERIFISVDADDKERIKHYLESTYKGSMSSFAYRLMMEKVIAWEERQEQRARVS